MRVLFFCGYGGRSLFFTSVLPVHASNALAVGAAECHSPSVILAYMCLCFMSVHDQREKVLVQSVSSLLMVRTVFAAGVVLVKKRIPGRHPPPPSVSLHPVPVGMRGQW